MKKILLIIICITTTVSTHTLFEYEDCGLFKNSAKALLVSAFAGASYHGFTSASKQFNLASREPNLFKRIGLYFVGTSFLYAAAGAIALIPGHCNKIDELDE